MVFPHRKKNLQVDEIVQKKYIHATDIFEFGPLLAGKSRDKSVFACLKYFNPLISELFFVLHFRLALIRNEQFIIFNQHLLRNDCIIAYIA